VADLVTELFKTSKSRGLALPDDEDSPAHHAQRALASLVSVPIHVELLLPEGLVCAGCCREPAAGVTVPEAAVHEDCCVVLLEDEVWSARHSGLVEAKPQAAAVEKAANSQFGHGVLPADAGHHPAAGRPVYNVDH